ncbi:LTA synthase family protein [Planococcus shenhongbingii]|uniref:LTA synthase family protein n=1 Tax=Planococcus shenhongbingii TaxID=3058398 RepID=A0ABT8NAC4_9BACL|nr:LTA synthase family protein [Planococcus sp. N017]MDN7244718.1 LTA synthase family protein [Planococcus sp. N017]
MKKFLDSHYLTAIFVMGSILLVAKLAVFRSLVFGEVSFLRILIIDFPMWMLIPALLFLMLKKVSPLILLIYNLIVSALMVSIIWYERYFQTVPSYYDLNQANQAGSVMETVKLLYSPWDLFFFSDLLIYIVFAIVFWKKQFKTVSRLKIGAVSAVLAVMAIATTAVAIQKPIIDITLFAKEQGFIQTQIVQALSQSSAVGHAEDKIMTDSELASLKGNEFVPYTEQERFGIAKDRHLFFIQVESLQALAINQSIGGQEITPNINALLRDSIYFNQVFQQIGAGNTSDAEWMFHTSLYPKGLEPTVNYVEDVEVPSMVRLLNDRDYLTTTYHADAIDYWNRDKLYPALGFQKAYTKEEIPHEDLVGIGPSDKVLFEFAAKEIKKQAEEGKKIYANIMTLTSHTPFEIPEDKQMLQLPAEFEGSYAGNYLQSVRYTDEQIGGFIKFLKEENLYEESLIVITGDHSGLHGTPMKISDTKLMSGLMGHTYTIKDRFLLPFIVAGPGLFNNEVHSTLGGQVDIMPTLTNLLGIVPEAPIVGHNLLEYENNLLTMRYYLSGGSFVTEKEIYLGQNARYPERYYDFDMMTKMIPVPDTVEKDQETIMEILAHSDAISRNYLNNVPSE